MCDELEAFARWTRAQQRKEEMRKVRVVMGDVRVVMKGVVGVEWVCRWV